jgi:hypothetical protein
MHQRFATPIRMATFPTGPWLKYDADFYRLWMRRAQALGTRTAASPLPEDGRSIARLATHYAGVVERLSALPVTFLHGEFYASNVLIGRAATGLRVCPIDWEMAAVGPGLVDLAALVSGHWTEAERTALALAYHAALTDDGGPVPSRDVFLNALDDCRLHLAVQWLGWSGNWSPPVEHRQDWLGEALRLAEKIGCL